jgi:hypothetical protein
MTNAMKAMFVVTTAKTAKGIDMRMRRGGPSRYSGLNMTSVRKVEKRKRLAVILEDED